MKKIPVVILALEDSGTGRSMEVYYWALQSSPFLEPIMVYSSLNSYKHAPKFIRRKTVCEIHPVDCSPQDSLEDKKLFRTYQEWFSELRPYIQKMRGFVGENAIWVLDMVVPELEGMLGKYIVQVFHGHLFEIGGGTYFDWEKISSFNKYWLVFTSGEFMNEKIRRAYHSKSIEAKIITSGKLLNFYLDEPAFQKKKYLQNIGLNAQYKTICYAPSWESKKIWPVGTFDEDIENLRMFCTWAKNRHLNLIVRPHHLAVQQYQVDKKMKQVAKEFKGSVYLEDTKRYSYQGPRNNLLASDLLITDLSSIAADFMTLKRPSIFFYPDNNQGLWGENLPTFEEVSQYSYVVRDFDQLKTRILSCLKKKENAGVLRKREKVVQHLFSYSGIESIAIFKKEIEDRACQIHGWSWSNFLNHFSREYCASENLEIEFRNEAIHS